MPPNRWVTLLATLATLSASPALASEPDLVQLTRDGHLKQRPAFSPDGKQLVFARHQGAAITLFLRNMKTGEEERLTKSANPEFDAVFSPDGASLLYVFVTQTPGQGNMEIHRLTLADRKSTPAATLPTLTHEEWPSWSPDGKRFAFTSTRDGNQELYVTNVEGGEWLRLTSDPAVEAHPAWSPDGKTIAFATSRWGDLEIALIDPDGQNLRRLTHSKGLDDYPAWSPNGKQLAFTSNRDGNLEIYLQPLEPDATGSLTPREPARNATQNEALDNFPTWTPAGRLVFVSNRGGDFDLYSMHP